MNRFKENKEDVKTKPKAPTSEGVKGVKGVLSGNFLSGSNVVSSLPFIFFLTFLGICYIANGYNAEKTIRELYKTGNEIKELRSEYITTKSELMYLSKQSQVAKATERIGLQELTEPPKKIIVEDDDKEIKEID
tara:strand:- start:1104 stop:1505 length:402 start_codon:yes stop_codon:yes gene_type:complete